MTSKEKIEIESTLLIHYKYIIFRVSCDEAKRVAVFFFVVILFSLANPKNPHLDQKKNQKKNRPTDGTDTVRRQVKKKTQKRSR
jgi:hypothetical protein